MMLLMLVAVVMCVSPALACSCSRKHPQSHFCDANFVVKAAVTAQRNDAQKMFNIFTVKINKIYKGNEEYMNMTDKSEIYTSMFDSMCGITLQTGKRYLLSGWVHNDMAYINLCTLILEWGDVPRGVKKGVSYKYHDNCGCKTDICYHPEGRCSTDDDVCAWTADGFSNNNCYITNSVCRKNSRGKCTWTNKKRLHSCLTNQSSDKGKNTSTPIMSYE